MLMIYRNELRMICTPFGAIRHPIGLLFSFFESATPSSDRVFALCAKKAFSTAFSQFEKAF
jgi:hypothetical protein